MSAYRDSLDDTARQQYAAAVEAAGRVLAHARRERETVAATEGPAGVAQRALTPGGLPAEAIEAKYLGLQQAARTERAA